MKETFEQIADFLVDNLDEFMYDNQFDEESFRSLVKGFAQEFESRIH